MDQQTQSNPGQSGSQALRVIRRRLQDGTLGEVFRDWKWIWSFSRGHGGAIALYTCFGILSSVMGLASGVASKYLIDCIVALDTQRLLPLAAAMVGIGAVSVAVRSAAARFSARLGVSMHNDVQAKVFESLLRSEWLEIRRYPTGDLLNRFSGDVSTVASCAVSWLPNVLIQIFTVLATLAVVLYYDPVMALIATASTPVLLFASRRLLRKQRAFNQEMRRVSSGMAACEAEVFRNVDTLKSFGVEGEMNGKLHTWQEKYRDMTLEYNEFSIKTNVLLTSLGTAVQYLALGYCLWRMWNGQILFGTMVLFLQQRSNLSNALSALISLIPTALNGSVAAERIRELTELRKEDHYSEISPVGGVSVELCDVQASYTAHRRVLSHVNIHVGRGEVVALVGPSGEGKSTLMRLLLGLVKPEAGSLYLSDQAGNRFPIGPATRRCMTYVPQGNTVMAGTIADNLRLVNPRVTEAEMILALKDACAWEFVRALPAGLHSPVGEGGKGLSEGQAQRIAIARALVRHAPVMLLDEATSALDYETEQQVLKNLMNRGVTCLVTTHRPSVLGMCAGAYRVRDGFVEKLSEEEIRNMLELKNA